MNITGLQSTTFPVLDSLPGEDSKGLALGRHVRPSPSAGSAVKSPHTQPEETFGVVPARGKTAKITITDAGRTMTPELAWDEINHQLRTVVGLSPEHETKARQCLQTLPDSKFQYFEDLTDAVISRLNKTEDTDYPLTSTLDEKDEPLLDKTTSGKLWTLCKYITTAAVAQSLLTSLPLLAAGTRTGTLRQSFQTIGSSGLPHRMTLPLPDVCKIQNAVDRTQLQSGQTICVQAGDGYPNTVRHFFINQSRAKKNIVLSTGHGSGDLSLFADQKRWPVLSRPPLSSAAGNAECAIIDKDPKKKWLFTSITGVHDKASLVVDFDTNKCRIPRHLRPRTWGRNFIYTLPDRCASHVPTTNGTRLTNRRVICLPNGNETNYYLVRHYRPLKNLVVTTGHGSGNLDVHMSTQGWDQALLHPPVSAQSDNNECVVFDNSNQSSAFIAVTGEKKGAALAIDFNRDQCRTPIRRGFTYKTSRRYEGYPYKMATLLLYKINFSDARLNWPHLEHDLRRMAQYFQAQSYGNFKLSWEMVAVNLRDTIGSYSPEAKGLSAASAFTAFDAKCRELVRETGISPWYPDADIVTGCAVPSFGDHSPFGGEQKIMLFDHKSYNQMGVIAHELGHALGLGHAKGIEGGAEIIKNMPDNDSWYNCPRNLTCFKARDEYLISYGNSYSLMGADAMTTTPGEMTLPHKSFFGWLNLETDVPLVTTTGNHRIYAFDHGDKSNGPVGLRLKSGNGDYTYWVEYRTTGPEANNTKQGVLINLDGYAQVGKRAREWKKTCYLLDMTPGSRNTTNPKSPISDFRDATLTVGNSFTDHWGGFTITPTMIGGTEDSADAWVEVNVVKHDLDETANDRT